MADKNLFGGGNAASIYVPMTEVEQEALLRLAEAKDFRVHIVGWGVVNNPRVIFGDLRLSFAFRLDFDRPAVPIPLYHIDLELRTGAGQLLYKDRQPTTYDGKPIQVAAGVFLDLVWDIAIKAIDPNLVKQLLPGVTGMTSRRTDKDTGEVTLLGNMKTTAKQRQTLRAIEHGEKVVKAMTRKRLAEKK